MSTQSKTIQAQVPIRLLSEMRALVEGGWFQSIDEIVVDAVRRFVESHHAELTEQFLREDVAWGLRGDD